MQFRTQKARGFRVLANMPNSESGDYGSGEAYGLPRWLKVARDYYVMPHNMPSFVAMEGPFFARPCPERPRHGFVESRPVNTLEQLLDVFVEARKADPLAEVLVMKPLTGKASAIATESGVTWGRGNDGVTGGKGDQLHIPCPSGYFTKHLKNADAELHRDIKGSLFCEIVEHRGEPYAVQLRDGPEIPSGVKNYVPHANYTVTNIVRPNVSDLDDLLGWEKQMQTADKGTLVHLKYGGLTSHAAVQAIAHGFAVVMHDSEVKVGDVLQPSQEQPRALSKRDLKTLRAMTKKRVFLDKKEGVALCIATLHAMPLWGPERHLLRLRAQAVLAMIRLLTAACVGEARHFGRFVMRRSADEEKGIKSAIDWKRLMGTDMKMSHPFNDRTVVHNAVLPRSLRCLKELLEGCVKDFSYKEWGSRKSDNGCDCRDCKSAARKNGGRYSYGYGGPKWRDSSQIGLDLCNALLAFQEKPEAERWKQVVLCYNRSVMAAHNGGKALDKFVEWSLVDLCAKAPQYGFVTKMAMDIVCELKKPEGIKPKPKQTLAARAKVRGKLIGLLKQKDIDALYANTAAVVDINTAYKTPEVKTFFGGVWTESNSEKPLIEGDMGLLTTSDLEELEQKIIAAEMANPPLDDWEKPSYHKTASKDFSHKKWEAEIDDVLDNPFNKPKPSEAISTLNHNPLKLTSMGYVEDKGEAAA